MKDSAKASFSVDEVLSSTMLEKENGAFRR